MERFTLVDASLENVRAWLRSNIEDGAECPCCYQVVKLYKRRLNSSMAAVLLMIHRWDVERAIAISNGTNTVEQFLGWLHVPSHIAATLGSTKPRQAAALRGDFAKLKHWGLIEDMPAKRDDGSKRNGYYRITDRGRAFARGDLKVQAYVWIYNEAVITSRIVTEEVSIREALKSKFNYQNLMDGR